MTRPDPQALEAEARHWALEAAQLIQHYGDEDALRLAASILAVCAARHRVICGVVEPQDDHCRVVENAFQLVRQLTELGHAFSDLRGMLVPIGAGGRGRN